MKCSFIKPNGEQCDANAMGNSQFCFFHNPETQEAKKEAVAKGGKSPKKNYNPLPSIELKNEKDVVKLLAQTINEVRRGEIELRVANCIGYLSGHLIKALEISELERKVEMIEKTLSNIK